MGSYIEATESGDRLGNIDKTNASYKLPVILQIKAVLVLFGYVNFNTEVHVHKIYMSNRP